LRLVQEVLPRPLDGRDASPHEADVAAVASLDEERRRSLEQQNAHMNRDWGSVFHAYHEDGSREASHFGSAILRHADLYMSRLENIEHYITRRHRFVPPKFTLPHEVMPYVDPVEKHIVGKK